MAEPKGPPSLREYWSDPKHNRRHGGGGRRESDYAVCHLHEQKCAADSQTHSALCKKVGDLKADATKDLDDHKLTNAAEHKTMSDAITKLGENKAPMWFVKILMGLAVIVFSFLVYENRTLSTKVDKLITITAAGKAPHGSFNND